MSAIESLAEYFTGPNVGHHSVALQMSGPFRQRAQDFFDTRAACGIDGYVSKEAAVKILAEKLKSS